MTIADPEKRRWTCVLCKKWAEYCKCTPDDALVAKVRQFAVKVPRTFEEWWDDHANTPGPDTYKNWEDSCRQAWVAGQRALKVGGAG